MMDYRSRKRRSRLRSFRITDIFLLSRLTKYAFFALIAGIIMVPILFLWYSRDLPSPGKIIEPKYKDATRIYDRTGKVLLYSVYQEQNRTYVTLNDIPKYLRQGTIAIEDENFYENTGFSVRGYLRVVRDALLFRGITGGSTITQQLVKNVLLTSERRLSRKIKEFVLSIQVDKRYSKDQVLELYLNNISYGGTAIGVEAAAQTYFGKKVNELDLAESAFLAGMPQSPSLYSPFTGNKYYVGRTDAVLKQMVSNKYISKKQRTDALEKIKHYTFARREEESIRAPHFVFYVKQKLAEQFGEQYVETGGLQVITSLDYELQKEAEKTIKEEIESLKSYKVGNGAALITNPKTGEILAMVGSKDYFDVESEGNFNVVTDGNRQPGSSLKPFIYAKAFEKGYTPASVLMDVKTEFPTDDPTQPIYTPENYSGKYTGPVQIRFALGNSLNIPAVKTLANVGIKDAMQKGYEMGIDEWEPTSENLKRVGLSLVLGGRETKLLNIVHAYGGFANKGIKQDLYTIQKVSDSKGKRLFEHTSHEGEKVLSEEIAFLISHILLDNVARTQEFGSNSFLRIPGHTVSVKTGTTDEKRDNWAIGYTPSLVVGVWVGNNDRTPMNAKIASGTTGATTIWRKLMMKALEGKDNEEFPVPSNVVAMQVDSFAGGLPVDGQSARTEYFIKGTEPTTKSQIYQKDFFVFKEDDPVSKDGTNRWQDGINKWIEANHKGDSKWNPPDDVKNPKQPENPTPTPEGENPTPTTEPSPTP